MIRHYSSQLAVVWEFKNIPHIHRDYFITCVSLLNKRSMLAQIQEQLKDVETGMSIVSRIHKLVRSRENCLLKLKTLMREFSN